jgi:uncharacterized membrane protein YkvA (DUF1232 family)
MALFTAQSLSLARRADHRRAGTDNTWCLGRVPLGLAAHIAATLLAMSEISESELAEHFDAFREWVSTIRQDIAALEAIVASGAIDRDARLFAAAALNYLAARMDLVPDWEESIGVLDDVMVLRICVDLASQHGLDDGLEEAAHIVAVGRLVNEGKRIDAFLGAALSADLRKYCSRLTETSVRGRGCSTLVDKADQREQLLQEIEQDLKRMPAAAFEDPRALAVKFKSYLAHKLKN